MKPIELNSNELEIIQGGGDGEGQHSLGYVVGWVVGEAVTFTNWLFTPTSGGGSWAPYPGMTSGLV